MSATQNGSAWPALEKEERKYPPDTLGHPPPTTRHHSAPHSAWNREETKKCPVNWILQKEFKVQMRRQNDKNIHKTEAKN